MSILRRIQSSNGQSNAPSESEGQSTPPFQSRRIVSPNAQNGQDTYQDLKTRVQNKLLAELDPSVDVSKVQEVRNTCLLYTSPSPRDRG